MIVAIDGPAGSGKSTVARGLAARLGFRYLDTGAMYRALTLLALEDGAELDDEAALAALARENPVRFEGDRVWVRGQDVTEAIRSPAVDRVVSTAAPLLVMTIATFMILDQLKIAEDIVVITYAALLGSIALGAALAFGLGGREVAAQMLQGAYVKGQEAAEQAKRDFSTGKQRVETQTSDRDATQATVIARQPEVPTTRTS